MMPVADRTKARLARLAERDHAGVAPAGRTLQLIHDEVRPAAFVLFHGLSSSPMQFVRFARDLHERGHNVIVPRLPRHGHRDRLCDALAYLRADDLRAVARESVEIARELGDRTIVAGFSLGGTLAAWIALQEPVHRVVAIAPFLGVWWMPNHLMPYLAHVLLRLPNRFAWWNPLLRERVEPPHGYPRYATHAVGQSYLLAHEVVTRARYGVAAEEVILVTNARETAVNNRAIRRLEAALRRHGLRRLEHVVLRGIPFSHDIIEPRRNSHVSERVYPQLFALIEGP
jgi:alpha-beta hydrolase superfamily lysophospholipase